MLSVFFVFIMSNYFDDTDSLKEEENKNYVQQLPP